MNFVVKTLLLSLSLLFNIQNLMAQAQAPAWISSANRWELFPDDKYLSAFDSQPIRKTDNLQEVQKTLLENAKINLVQSISTRIDASTTLNTENRNTNTLEIFKQASTSTAQAELTGLKCEEHYDQKKKVAYAFVYLNIRDFLTSTQNTLTLQSNELSKKIETARQYMKDGNRGQALKTYLECFPLLREMENRIAIVFTLSKSGITDHYVEYRDSVARAISELRTGPRTTIEDLCVFIANGLKQQIPSDLKDFAVRIGNFTYMDSHMGSSFAVRLAASLQPKLLEEGISVYHPDQSFKDRNYPWVLSGTYWLDGKNLKIIINVDNEKTGKTIASIEDFLPLTWLTEREIAYVPDNYQSALNLEKELSKNEIVKTGLMAKLWTNQGKNNPVYKQGETMDVYVQVDRPCYIRLIYYTADGNKWLLENSLFMDEGKINKPFQVNAFTCTPPFGAEILQLVAQTAEFSELVTKKEGKNEIILDDDRSAIGKTRGMQAKMPDLLIAEKRINITTLEK